MGMVVSVEFTDAGTKSGTHRVLIVGRGSEGLEAGDIGLSLRPRRHTPLGTARELPQSEM
jgi:hypothetical protein